MAFIPRLTPPTDFSTYYTEKRLPVSDTGTLTGWQYYYSGPYTYTNTGAHTGNCTWYAMGRSAEIAGRNLYSEFSQHDAGNWNNVWRGNPAQTSGTIDFRKGDILVWSGHVEIVEEINGNRLTISYSAYSTSNPDTIAAQSQYGMFFGVRYRNKPSFGDPVSVSSDRESWMKRNNNDEYVLNEPLIGVIHNIYADDDPPVPPEPPTPVTVPTITITPSSYSVTMGAGQQYLDFSFEILIDGIPAGETASGGTTFPGLIRIYNTSWTYTDYQVGGVTYRQAYKRMTLRYYRELSSAYSITKYLYYTKTWSNGSVSETVPIDIDIEADTSLLAMLDVVLRKRRERFSHVFRI